MSQVEDRSSKQLTADHEHALKWARSQNFGSVAARYAKLCAEAYDIVRAADEPSAAHELVLRQAADEGLWFQAETASEAYLQQELRKLHAAIEGEPIEFARPEPPTPPLRVGDEVMLERYRSRNEHEGWRIVAIIYDLAHPMGGRTCATRDEVRPVRAQVLPSGDIRSQLEFSERQVAQFSAAIAEFARQHGQLLKLATELTEATADNPLAPSSRSPFEITADMIAVLRPSETKTAAEAFPPEDDLEALRRRNNLLNVLSGPQLCQNCGGDYRHGVMGMLVCGGCGEPPLSKAEPSACLVCKATCWEDCYYQHDAPAGCAYREPPSESDAR